MVTDSSRVEAVELPLCVDLDGTLLRTDLLVESALSVLARSPGAVLQWPLLLLKGGRPLLKERLAIAAQFSVPMLPLRNEVVEFIRSQKESGRRIILATASHRLLAEKVAAHLGLFDEVLATDHKTNLKGAHKADVLVARFGAGGFDYIADHPVDLAVWRRARKAYVVSTDEALVRRVHRTLPDKEVQLICCKSEGRFVLKNLLRALRVHQWSKNALIFLPAIMAHRVFDPQLMIAAALAFISFSLCASGVYVINDLVDLESDRAHRSKKHRPFASGALPITTGFLLIPFLLAASVTVALFLPVCFLAVLAGYFATTLAYSFFLKRVAVLDIVILASLYTVRLIAGALATSVVISEWLLAFSMFFFLSLACMKRYSELRVLKLANESHTRGRGYLASDLEQISQFGSASGYLSVLVLALYVSSTEVTTLYTHPSVIWLVCPILLYWITRVWLLAHRGEVHDDPIVFAISDRVSYVVGALAVAVLLIAV